MSGPLAYPLKFDPVAVNRTIDNMLAAVPPGQRGILVMQADLQSKKVSGALMFKVTNNIGGYVRVSKIAGAPLDVDAGGHVSFLYDSPYLSEYDFPELIELFRARGFGWIKSFWSAYRLANGWELEL